MSEINENHFKNLQDKWTNLKEIYKSGKEMDDDSLNALKKELRYSCENLMKTTDKQSEMYYRVLGIKYALEYEFAKILVSNKRDNDAQEFLQSMLNSAKEHELKPEIAYINLKVINYLSFLLTKNNNFKQSQLLLEKAENIYDTLKKSGDDLSVFVTEDLFKTCEATFSPESMVKFERIVTNNFLVLGCIHNKQGDWDKSVYYNHLCLQRQLDFKDYDPIAWASKASYLATSFLTRNGFKEARHLLSAALFIIEQHELTAKCIEQTEENKRLYNEVRKKYADISRLWVKYGLYLFNMSKMRLMSMFYGDSNQLLEHLWETPFDDHFQDTPGSPTFQSASPLMEPIDLQTLQQEALSENQNNLKLQKDEETINVQKAEEVDVVEQSSKDCKSASAGIETCPRDSFRMTDNGGGEKLADDTTIQIIFKNLNLKSIEERVSVDYVETSHQARELFIHSMNWLKKCNMFYNLREYPMEYVKNTLDLSELYRYLAFFEEDIESQYTVQQKRANSLETLSALVKDIRPPNYIEVNIDLIKELAEVHLEITGLNLRRLFVATGAPEQTDQFHFTVHKMDATAGIINELENFRIPQSDMYDLMSDFENSADTTKDTDNQT